MAHRWSNFDPENTAEGTASRIRKSYRSLTREASKSRWLSHSAQFAATVVVPIAVGYCVNLVTSGDTTKEAVGWTALAAIVVLQSVLVIGLLVGPSTPANVIQDLEAISEDRDTWIAHAKSLDHVGGAFASATTCSSDAVAIALSLLHEQDSSGGMPETSNALEKILKPYIELRHEALNFSRTRGRYSFTIFELDEDNTVLRPIFSHHDEGIVDRGRHLPVSSSHAGRAVLSQQTKITDDARAAEEFLDILDLEDRQNYRAMASFPLFSRGDVFGAGTITCDVPSQFGVDGADVIFDTLGGIISLYLSSRDCEQDEIQADTAGDSGNEDSAEPEAS